MGKREGYPGLQDKPEYWSSKVKPKLELIEGWARHGLSIAQIAKNLGVGTSTLQKYRVEHPELEEVLRSAREDGEILVENALFKRAVGYKYNEVTKERVRVMDEEGNWTGKYEMVTTKKIRKYQAPDVTAQVYWLEHRAPKRWEKNPMPGIDISAINVQIYSLANLLANPVPERAIGCEDEEE